MHLLKPVLPALRYSLLLSAGLVLSFPGTLYAGDDIPRKALLSDISGALPDINRPAPDQPDALAGPDTEHRVVYGLVYTNNTDVDSTPPPCRRLYQAYLLKRPPPA